MTTLKGETIVADFNRILLDYVDSRYGTGSKKAENELVEVL